MTSDNHADGTGVSFRAELPLDWEPLDGPPDIDRAARLDAGNESLLAGLLSLDEPLPEADEEGARPEHWRRLDAKLDLALGLLSELLARQETMPPQRPVRLGDDWLEIETVATDELPEAGSHLLLRLYLSPRIPRPLTFVARVDTASQRRPRLGLCQLGEATRDLLGRYVFRQHRRAVALSRAHPR